MKRLAAYTAAAFIFAAVPALSGAVTVAEVAHELECPCECPLVLEDCNMTCGIEWKDEIGRQIAEGKTKDEILADFIMRYGDAVKLTPARRLKGKFYQYTRGFKTFDWVLLGAGAAAWCALTAIAAYLAVRRLVRRKDGKGEGG